MQRLNLAPILSAILLGLYAGFGLHLPYLKILSQENETFIFFDGKYEKDLPKHFEQLAKEGYAIKGIDFVYEDYLVAIPTEIIGFDNFYELGVFRGEVKEIPAAISQMKLRRLQIQDQKLTRLPAQIGEMESLILLKLGGNNLTGLPPEIGRLKNLEVLHLYNNSLRQLPREIGNLQNLKILDLHANNLTRLPQQIESLKKLGFLYLGGNKLTEDEKERIKDRLPETKIYF